MTWWLALPVSESHILIGGLVGSGIAAAGLEVVTWNGIVNKVLVPMVVAPLVGLTLAFLLAVGIRRAFRHRSPGRVNRGFAKVQLRSSFFASLMHGANDGQKFVGVMTALLVGAGWLAWVATGVLATFVTMEDLKRLISLHDVREDPLPNRLRPPALQEPESPGSWGTIEVRQPYVPSSRSNRAGLRGCAAFRSRFITAAPIPRWGISSTTIAS